MANRRITRPPGPRPHFLIGNFPLGRPDPLAVFTGWAREFGDIFYYRAGWIHVYFLNSPELIESVLVTNQQNFRKDRVIQNSRWFLGQGLLTSEGGEWLRQRRLSQPAFHRERLALYARIINGCAEEMLDSWKDGENRDVHQEMMQLTLRVVAKVLFSVDVKNESKEVAAALNLLMKHSSGARMLLPPWVRYLPLPFLIRVRRAVRQLDEVVYRIIRERRRSENDNGDQTTALSLSWAWFLLSENPEAENKLHHELARVLDGKNPSFEDLPRLCYTEAVVKESMRLYPPAWSLARTAARDFEVGGYLVPAGANVVMSQWIMHRDPRFFPSPEQFDPGRWFEEPTQRLPRFAYFPFGGGPRYCVGASFAMMEATLLLAAIAQRFRLRMVPGHNVVPVPSITLRPKYGIKMSLHQIRV